MVNAYSSRYYTLRCYFAGLNEDEYASYINMDTSANVDSSADTINLDAMREDYSTSTLPSEDNDSGNEIVVPEDTTIPEPAVQPDFTNPENSVPTSSPSQNEQTTTPTLDEYYAQATAAYSTFIQSLSTYGDLSAGYQDAKQKILRCEGYQDSTAMLKVVECLYTAHVKMGPTSGWNADLDSMAVHATGTNISITKEDFIGNGSSLRLSSDVSKKTFTATLSHVFAANMRNHGEIKVIEALILLFSNIEDTAALTAKLENENNWALNGENETISFTYSDYSVAIQVSPEAQGYINCVISVAKQ